jgi:AcrR family transcriptional regulator
MYGRAHCVLAVGVPAFSREADDGKPEPKNLTLTYRSVNYAYLPVGKWEVQMMESRRVKAASLADEILSRAADLFGRRSYDSVSMREIAEACGVSKPALYYHFKSKQELAASVIDSVFDELEADIARLSADPSEDLVEFLRRIYVGYMRLSERRPLMYNFAISQVVGGLEGDLVQQISERNFRVEKLLFAAMKGWEDRGDLHPGGTAVLLYQFQSTLILTFVAFMRGNLKYTESLAGTLAYAIVNGVAAAPVGSRSSFDALSYMPVFAQEWEKCHEKLC